MKKQPVVSIGLCTPDGETEETLFSLTERFAQAAGREFRVERSVCPEPGKYDVLFWDVAGAEQLEQVRALRQRDHCAVLILLSEQDTMALAGYELSAKGWLCKPVETVSCCNALLQAMRELDRKRGQWLLLSDEKGTLRLFTQEIQAVRFQREGVRLMLEENDCMLACSAEQFCQAAEGKDFLRCGPKTLVNPAWVTRLQGRRVTVGTYTLPVEQAQLRGFRSGLMRYYNGV